MPIEDWVCCVVTLKSGVSHTIYLDRDLACGVCKVVEKAVASPDTDRQILLIGRIKNPAGNGLVLERTLVVATDRIASVEFTDAPQFVYPVTITPQVEDDNGNEDGAQGNPQT